MTFANTGAVLTGPDGRFELREWDIPQADQGVIVEVELSGVCGSDLHVYKGEWIGATFPLLLGHEITGTVASLPPGGQSDLYGQPLELGDRVVAASAFFGECGRCIHCAQLGAPWACTHRTSPKLQVDGAPVATFGGGFARYLQLSPPESSMLIKIDVPAEAGVLYEPLSVAVQMVAEGPPILGQDVVVQGTGAVGLLTILVARLAGASKVIAVGAPDARLETARAFGADETISIETVRDVDDRVAAVREATHAGLGAIASYEIAGAPSAVGEGLRYLQPDGWLVEGGNAADTGTAEINPHRELWRGRNHVIGIRGRTLSHFTTAARLLPRLADELQELVTHRLPLARAGDAMRALDRRYELDDRSVLKIVMEPNA